VAACRVVVCAPQDVLSIAGWVKALTAAFDWRMPAATPVCSSGRAPGWYVTVGASAVAARRRTLQESKLDRSTKWLFGRLCIGWRMPACVIFGVSPADRCGCISWSCQHASWVTWGCIGLVAASAAAGAPLCEYNGPGPGRQCHSCCERTCPTGYVCPLPQVWQLPAWRMTLSAAHWQCVPVCNNWAFRTDSPSCCSNFKSGL
jgi:hypothetical protein